MEATIFNIQRYSTHDGPGIRTNVFLSGCSLRCRWCANPESWIVNPEIYFAESRCIGCMGCVKVARHGEVEKLKGIPQVNRSLCVGTIAEQIVDACPTGAMTVKQRRIDVSTLIEEVMKDAPFYERSGGGVTFTGGEPLLQSDFVSEGLKALKERKIHTAIETAGNVQWENIEQVIPQTDLFLYDVKCIDSNLHKKYTESGNEQILGNLKRLRARTKNIHVRVPVIPGFNADVESIKQIKDLLDELQITERTLLPFHQYGSSKYKAIGRDYELDSLEQMKKEDVDLLAEKVKFYRVSEQL